MLRRARRRRRTPPAETEFLTGVKAPEHQMIPSGHAVGVPQQVVPVDLGVMWEPNAPEAVLVRDDSGRACLAVMPHFDDSDRRPVVLVWERCVVVVMGAPNDEALHLHPLFESGLGASLWIGEVLESERLAAARSMVSVAPSRHFVVPLKESLVEALASALTVRRVPGTTAEAAFAALTE